jgi:hypothetical protein
MSIVTKQVYLTRERAPTMTALDLNHGAFDDAA